MGFLLDIVPNHVGVDDATANPWWWDVLAHGRGSRYASYFDIDWDGGPILLPVLGAEPDPDDEEKATRPSVTLSDDRTELRYYDHAFPVAPGTATDGWEQVRRGARPPALRAGLVETRRGGADLPAVLRRHHTRGRPGRGPGGVRGHARRGAALGRGGRGRRAAGRPPGRPVRPRRLRAPAARGDRARPLAAGGEDPRRRRGAARVVAGRRHDRVRGAARDLRGVRRPGRRGAAHPAHRRAPRAQGERARGRARGPPGGRPTRSCAAEVRRIAAWCPWPRRTTARGRRRRTPSPSCCAASRSTAPTCPRGAWRWRPRCPWPARTGRTWRTC